MSRRSGVVGDDISIGSFWKAVVDSVLPSQSGSGKKKKYKPGRISVASVARFLEFGTTKMAPRPFMTQAFQQTRDAAIQDIVDELHACLDDVCKNPSKPDRK